MPRDIEELLRQSLQARAADVTPDPATFAKVQDRIRRGRTFRLALAGAATALVVAGVAVAAPRLIDRRIEFEPGPVATAPAPDATPGATPDTSEPAAPVTTGPSHLVFSDGADVYGMALDGESADELIPSGCGEGAVCDMEPVRSVTALTDGTDPADITAVAASCTLRYSVGAGPVETLDPGTDVCATSVAFSPDGRHLAWIGVPSGGGEPLLHTVDWSATGPGADEASFGLPWAGASEVSIQDWVWTEQGSTTASGYLAVRARRQDVVQLLQMPIERQGDGAIGVTLEAGPVATRPGFAPVAFAASANGVTATFEVLQEPDGLTGATVVRRSGSDITAEIAVPDELFDSPDFNESDVWLSDSGGAVIFGNAGNSRAWYVDYDRGDESATPIALSATIVHGDLNLVVPTGSDAPTDAPEPLIDVDIFFGMEGADACVATQPVVRSVEGPGVARAALTELLAGPTPQESNSGIVSAFSANTAGALNDIAITDGEAQVDFANFSGDVGTDSCTKSTILDSLDSTLLQFPTVTSTRYSFDGSTQAWDEWLGSSSEPSGVPAAVTEKWAQVLAAATARDYQALKPLMREGFACAFSDQPEPCVPIWKEQDRNGEDPLGTLVEILEQEPIRNPDAPIWIWPAEWADENYLGPRTGIDEGGTWLYYQQGGD